MKLTITNFRNLEHKVYDLSQGLFVTGMNGSGKSTALDALRLCYLGHCRGTDARGAGAKHLVGKYGKVAVVKLETDDYTVKVQLNKEPPHLSWTGTVGTKSITKYAELSRGIKADADIVMLVLWPEKYINDILADYLSKSLDREIPIADVEEYFKGNQAVLDWLPKQRLGKIPTIEGLRKLGEKCFEKRRDIKRDLSEDKDVPEYPKSAKGEPLGLDDLPRLKELVKQLSEQRGHLKSKSTEVPANTSVLKRGLETIEERLKAAQESKSQADSKRETMTKLLDTAQRKLNEALAEKSRRETQVEMAQSEVNRLSELGEASECPTCGQAISDEIMGQMVALANDELERANVEFGKAETFHDDILESQADAKAALANLPDEREQNRQIMRLEDQKNDLRKKIQAAANTRNTNTASVEDKLKAIDERIVKAEGAIEQLEVIKDAEDHNQRMAEIRDEVEVLSAVIKAFRDGDMLNRYASEDFTEFSNKVNAVLEPLGKRLSFAIEGKKVTMRYQNQDGPEYDITLASRGEYKCIETAIVAAFSKEAPVCCVDDLDCLDDKNRKPTLRLLKEMATTVPVVCTATWTKPATDGQAMEALKHFLRPMPVEQLSQGVTS